MTGELQQGDILKIEKIKFPVLIVSNDFFNKSGEIIGCPITMNAIEGPLHIFISANEVEGYVLCEQLKLFDLRVRGHKKIDQLKWSEKINISDAVQGIFEYI